MVVIPIDVKTPMDFAAVRRVKNAIVAGMSKKMKLI
jgi:hypothetical protein